MKGQDNPLIPNPHPHLLNSTIKKPIIVPLSYQPKKTHKPRTAIRTTEISQSSGPINLVVDETVYKEWEDKMERAATTASSLDAEQDNGNIIRTQSMFWETAKAKTVNGERQLQALVDKKKVIITDISIRSDLHLEDAGGIDCLPTTTIFEELKKQSRRKQKKTTAVPHPSDSTADVPNEESVPAHSNDLLLSARESKNLKLRVKKLEKKAGLRTHKFKRLYKVGVTRRVECSNDESLGAQKDAFNQGRSIKDIDKDAKVSLVDETQGRSNDAEMFDTDTLIANEFFAKNDMIEKDQDVIPKEVSTDAPSTTAVSPPIITGVEITLAQTLAKLKSAKSKVVIQELVQSTATTAPSTIPKSKGITFRDAGEITTRTPTSVSSSSIKDKGKSKMDELEVPLKKKDQIALDEEMAQIQAELIEEERLARKKEEEANIALIKSWDNTQAMMEADFK
ncbi:hypothetical protein Tco_0677587 [Tanacetum coccineum]|uniref:Uncharacterized protein n=1 Tax=Tanacetum coccineum TaxID=301880 RepID=A0ABQ4XDI5_9ASTR